MPIPHHWFFWLFFRLLHPPVQVDFTTPLSFIFVFPPLQDGGSSYQIIFFWQSWTIFSLKAVVLARSFVLQMFFGIQQLISVENLLLSGKNCLCIQLESDWLRLLISVFWKTWSFNSLDFLSIPVINFHHGGLSTCGVMLLQSLGHNRIFRNYLFFLQAVPFCSLQVCMNISECVSYSNVICFWPVPPLIPRGVEPCEIVDMVLPTLDLSKGNTTHTLISIKTSSVILAGSFQEGIRHRRSVSGEFFVNPSFSWPEFLRQLNAAVDLSQCCCIFLA